MSVLERSVDLMLLLWGCNATLLADGKCDEECSSEVCGLDLGDCGFCTGGCTRELFFNEVCDEVCNVEECGFDNGKCMQCAPGCYTHTQVADGHCDSECFEEKCDFDGKDCGYCAEDCPLQRLGDGHCDEACVSKLCGGDGGDCGTQLVGECLLQWVGDGVCQPQCWTRITSWDGGDCDCAPGCTQELQFNDNCDEECANSQCDWDNHQCVTFIQGVCATGCMAELLADGVCENDCNTPECGFDSGDCLCAPKCEPQLSSTCNSACMNPSCEYGHFPSGCSSHFLVALALAHQTLHRELSTTFNRTQCTTSAPMCNFESFETSFQLGQCEENCKTKECDFALGLCSEYVEDNCARGYSETPGSCFECKNNFLLFNGFCVEKCPNGFKEYIGLIKLCVEIEDFGHALDHIYVLDEHEGDGSFDYPFGSLYIGLATAWHTNTVIELLGNEVQLKVAPTWNLYKTHENRLNPLKGSRTTNLTIKSLLCQDTAHSSCSSRPSTILISEPVSLTASGLNITIENVFITSRTVFEQSTFNYCPALVLKDGMYWDDRNLKATMDRINAAALCQQFSNFSLIIVESGSNLWMKVRSRQNVTITNFTIQALALINIKRGNIVLESVNFNNVQPSMSAGRSAIILQSGDCEPLEECGSLLYRIGSVRFINDGYEFKETIQLRPFLSVDSMRSIEVAGINFEYCSVADFSEKTSLLFIQNFVTLNLTECSFENNLFIGNLLRVHSSEYFPLTAEKQGHSELHELTHITLQSLLISRVYAQSGIISIESSGDMLNIQIHNCSFVESASSSQSLIAIFHSVAPTSTEIFGGTLIYKNATSGLKRTAMINSISMQIAASSFLKCANYFGLIRIENYANIATSRLAIIQNGNATSYESLIRSYYSFTYARILPELPTVKCCSEAISLTGIVNAIITDAKIVDNTCNSDCVGIAFKRSHGLLSIPNLLFANNTSTGAGAAIESFVDPPVIMTNATVANNTNALSGLIVLHRNASVEVLNSAFLSNSGFSGSVIASNGGRLIAISQSDFRNNTARYAGGAIYVEVGDDGHSSLAIGNSSFLRNRATLGGGIYISSLGSTLPLQLTMRNSTFSNNFAVKSGASLFESSSLSPESLIDTCLFSNEVSPSGSLLVSHQYGQLAISASVFTNNSGSSASAISLEMGETSSVSLTYSTFSNNSKAPAVHSLRSSPSTYIFTKKCQFAGNGGGAVLLESGNWTDVSSAFSDSATSAVVVTGTAAAKMRDSLFTSNRSPGNGGAVAISFGGKMTCENCTFRSNFASTSGGALFAERSGEISISRSTFEGNSADGLGAAMHFLSAQNVIIRSCRLHRNTVRQTALISMHLAELYLDSSVIMENYGNCSAGLSLTSSSIAIANCTFSSQYSHQAAFFSIQSASFAVVRDTAFQSLRGGNSGGIYIESSSLSVTNSTFHNVTGSQSCSISASRLSTISLESVTITDSQAADSGSLIALSNSMISIYRSLFRDYSGGAVFADISSVEVTGSVFSRGRGVLGSAIACISCRSVDISRSSFVGQMTELGVVYIDNGDWEEPGGTVSIIDSEFANNTGASGTAFYSLNSMTSILRSVFQSNTAGSYSGEGGALYLDCTHESLCSANITDSTFFNNSAALAGGAIAWRLVKPLLVDVVTYNNTAEYGVNLASFPATLAIATTETHTPSDAEDLRVQGLAPGQVSSTTLVVTLVDHYGQVVKSEGWVAELVPNDPVAVSVLGTTKVVAEQGGFLFSNFTLFADPGTPATVEVIVTSDGRHATNLQVLSRPIVFDLRGCIPGESAAEKSCNICEFGTYGLDPLQPCQNCPPHAHCLGNYTLLPDAGYWRPGNLSNSILPCPRASACLGGTDHGAISLTGFCAEGYEGNLCQSCAAQFSRIGRNTCSRCPSLAVNIIRLGLIACALVVLISVLVYTSMRSSTRPAAVHSIYLKILVNYFQLVALMAEFRLHWPDIVVQLFQIQENIGITEQLLSLDCFLSENEKAADIFYYKIVYMACLPLLLATVVVGYWVGVAVYRKKKKKLRKQLPATLVIAFFCMYTTVARSLFSIFNCRKFNNEEYWLSYDMSIRCWDAKHYKYLFQVGLPAVAVWVLGVPLVCLSVLVRCRNKLEKIWLRLAFGFLINGYRRRHFYWEFVVISRKLTIICCSVLITTSSAVQALVVQLVLVIHFLIHWVVSPYIHTTCNLMELRAIIVAGITIYCGLFYLTDDLTAAWSWFFFAVILGINVVFLLLWMNAIIRYFLMILARKIPLIRHIYSPEIAERDEFIERFISMFGKERSDRYADFCYLRVSEVYSFLLTLRQPTITVPEVSQGMHTYIPRIPMVKNRSFEADVKRKNVREMTAATTSRFSFVPELYNF